MTTATLSRPAGTARGLGELALAATADEPVGSDELQAALDAAFVERRDYLVHVNTLKQRRKAAAILEQPASVAVFDRELAAQRERLRVECEGKRGELQQQIDVLVAQQAEAMAPLAELDGRIAEVERIGRQVVADSRQTRKAAREILLSTADPTIAQHIEERRQRLSELQRSLQGCRLQLLADPDALRSRIDSIVLNEKADRVNDRRNAYRPSPAEPLSQELWRHEQAVEEIESSRKQIADVEAEIRELETSKLDWRNAAAL